MIAQSISLRAPYAMSGTDVASQVLSRVPGTEWVEQTVAGVGPPLLSYAFPTRCPVLTSAMPLHQALVLRIASCPPGEVRYPPTRVLRDVRYCTRVWCYGLRACYEMSGTDCRERYYQGTTSRGTRTNRR
eukprot:3313337-Rhodomonas_salina.2